jgi:hypothetical protein
MAPPHHPRQLCCYHFKSRKVFCCICCTDFRLWTPVYCTLPAYVLPTFYNSTPRFNLIFKLAPHLVRISQNWKRKLGMFQMSIYHTVVLASWFFVVTEDNQSTDLVSSDKEINKVAAMGLLQH